jgi:hypothetical protein
VRIPAASRFTVLALVVLALVALAAVAWLGKPVTVSAGQQATVLRTAPVNVGVRACPSPGSPGSHRAGLAVVAAAGGSGPGQAAVSRLSVTDPAISQLRRLSQPGALSLTGVSAAPAASRGSRPPSSQSTNKSAVAVARPGGVMVQATGSMARGLEAEQTAGGVATARCGSPGTDFWFAVPGEQAAGTIELDLMNVDSQLSTADVDVFTDTGPLHTGADTGITVPAHGLVVQPLAGLVHGSQAIALHVRTNVGRVVAALRESSQRNGAGEWLSPAQSPSRRLVIPGMPGSRGTRMLYVADPGGNDAQVKLSVVSPGGTYRPTGGGAIDVPAGSANRIQLSSLSGVAGAVVITSSVPVTAAVTVPGGSAGAPGAMTASAPALQEQGVLADVGQRANTTTLVLSAPDRAARVRLTIGVSGLTASGRSAAGPSSGGSASPSSASPSASPGTGSSSGSVGPSTTRVISVRAHRSATVKITAPRGSHWGGGFAVVLTPLSGSGPVYAGRVLASKGGIVLGIMPVASALTWVPLSPVRNSLLTATPTP